MNFFKVLVGENDSNDITLSINNSIQSFYDEKLLKQEKVINHIIEINQTKDDEIIMLKNEIEHLKEQNRILESKILSNFLTSSMSNSSFL